MTKEIEIKVLNIDLDDMERKLKELGAKLISKEYQKNIELCEFTFTTYEFTK